MKQAAVQKAEARLEECWKESRRILASTSFEETQSAWTNFLFHANAIYLFLEQGTKYDSKSGSWFGRKKHERKTDPLLNYLHHARNSNEHGLVKVIGFQPGGLAIGGGRNEGIFFKHAVFRGGKIEGEIEPIGGISVGYKIIPSTSKLVEITDGRSGKRYPPPTTHLGKDLHEFVFGASPLGVVIKACIYLDRLIKEAKQFTG